MSKRSLGEELLTVKEVAAFLKVSRKQVCKMIHQGDLDAKLVGREYRISIKTLAEFLER